MPIAQDVNQQALVAQAAKELEKLKELTPPAWASFVKTGVSRERPPTQPDWWWIRSASVLRRLSEGQPLGVSRLRRAYGGRKNRGHKPEHKFKGSGSVIRTALQQLEAAGLVKAEKGKGRFLTPKGASFLAKAAKTAGA